MSTLKEIADRSRNEGDIEWPLAVSFRHTQPVLAINFAKAKLFNKVQMWGEPHFTVYKTFTKFSLN